MAEKITVRAKLFGRDGNDTLKAYDVAEAFFYGGTGIGDNCTIGAGDTLTQPPNGCELGNAND